MPTPKKKARPVKKMTARSLPKLETPVGDPIRLQLTTPAHVVDAHVVLLSGCKDEQESADVSATSAFGLPKNAGPGGAGGACTNAMLKCMHDDNPDDSWLTVLVGMQSWLRENGYDQVPQISCGNDGFDFRRPFSLLHPRCGGDPRRAGRTRAVLIGVNYVGTDVALDGAWNDVEKMRSFLHDEAGFSRDKDSMRVLRDNGTDAAPTKANIEKAMRWLVKGAAAGDSLVLHFSGHGVRTSDAGGDESDGMDEALVPSDFRDAGCVVDDDIFQTCVRSLPKGVSLVAIMDCCHSGTLMDLAYDFTLTEKQFAHEKERIAKRVPLNGNALGEFAHGVVHAVPNTAKRVAMSAVKVVDVACEGVSEILQRVATSIPVRAIRAGYDAAAEAGEKNTGWRVGVHPADVRVAKFVS